VTDAVEHIFLYETVALVEADRAVVSSHHKQDVGLGLEPRVQLGDQRCAHAPAAKPLVDVDPVKLGVVAEAVEMQVPDDCVLHLGNEEHGVFGPIAARNTSGDRSRLVGLRRDGIHHFRVDKARELPRHRRAPDARDRVSIVRRCIPDLQHRTKLQQTREAERESR